MDPETKKNVEESSSYRSGSKLQVALKEDGSIDLDSMRDSTKEKLRQALSATPGIYPDGAAKSEVQTQIFHPTMVAGMYSMLGAVEAMALSNLFKVPAPIARQVFTYSAEEIVALTPPTVRVLNKYATEWMVKYQDEIALASMLVAMTVTKVQSALVLTKMQQNVNGASSNTGIKTEETGKKEEDIPPGPVQ